VEIPTIQLGDLKVTRFIIGGNPFSGFSHQSKERDAEMRSWYTDDRIVETFFQAESAGVSAVIARGDEHMTRCLARYWREGGAMRWIAQTASEAPSALAGVEFCIEHGASACFIHGGIADNCVAQGRYDELRQAAERIKAAGIPAGIAGHLLEDFGWAEGNLSLDFYMVCYYNPSSRRDSPHHVHGTVERFSKADRDERVALIRTLERPAIHYKILAAGRVAASDAFAYAARQMRPIDAVCVGIFAGDNGHMIEEDVRLLLENLP